MAVLGTTYRPSKRERMEDARVARELRLESERTRTRRRDREVLAHLHVELSGRYAEDPEGDLVDRSSYWHQSEAG